MSPPPPPNHPDLNEAGDPRTRVVPHRRERSPVRHAGPDVGGSSAAREACGPRGWLGPETSSRWPRRRHAGHGRDRRERRCTPAPLRPRDSDGGGIEVVASIRLQRDLRFQTQHVIGEHRQLGTDQLRVDTTGASLVDVGPPRMSTSPANHGEPRHQEGGQRQQKEEEEAAAAVAAGTRRHDTSAQHCEAHHHRGRQDCSHAFHYHAGRPQTGSVAEAGGRVAAAAAPIEEALPRAKHSGRQRSARSGVATAS